MPSRPITTNSPKPTANSTAEAINANQKIHPTTNAASMASAFRANA
jgi:hypothetical protein